MAVFFVNGKEVEVTKNQKLLRYLRDELHLTSVKDGCSEGACGACTVIIDGETIRACTPMTDRLEGKHIITVEGLTDEEKELYTYAYGEAGAVQCGFCIPGMVLCTKALLDKNQNPTDAEIRYALRNNYCRCTGYVKIIAAVRLAAKLLREGGAIPAPSETDWKVGSSVHRLDVEEKVLGYDLRLGRPREVCPGAGQIDRRVEGACASRRVRSSDGGRYPGLEPRWPH